MGTSGCSTRKSLSVGEPTPLWVEAEGEWLTRRLRLRADIDPLVSSFPCDLLFKAVEL